MNDFLHSLAVVSDKCCARLHCMRVCPTHAIRVRNNKAQIDPELCIDCGECIIACPENAIRSTTDTLKDIQGFKYKVAIPSPPLFGHFQINITPADIAEGLTNIGFDAVYFSSVEIEMINLAIRDYLDEHQGPYPLISSACPVVVRLIQVAYPEMVDQVIPIEPAREIAAREMKKLYSRRTGLSEDEIGAIYITPCPAKLIAIKQPAEKVKSYFDFAIGISEIYNPLLAAITRIKREGNGNEIPHKHTLRQSRTSLSWAVTGGQGASLKPSRYLTVEQLSNMIRIFDDIEKGKIKGIEFLECYSCYGGCIGGPLTVDDTFVCRSKIQKLIEASVEESSIIQKDAKKQYVEKNYFIRQKLEPRKKSKPRESIEIQIGKMRIREDLAKKLPAINCGLCGAPTCRSLAEDVAESKASPADCVLLSRERATKLQKAYNIENLDSSESGE